MGATGRGDKGKTSLLGGREVWKDHCIIKAVGTTDELNAVLGLCRKEVKNNKIKKELSKIQKEMFVVGSYLSGYVLGASKKIPESRIKEIENEIKELLFLHEKPRFIIPSGSRGALFLHLARTICRRLERNVVSLIKEEGEKPGVLGVVKYLNRMSDLLYYFALLENKENEIIEEYI